MVMGRIKRLYPSKMLSDAREAYASRGASGAAGSIASSIGASPFKLLAESVKRPTSMFWKGLSTNKSILGINVGLGSFLKQSQVFTAAVSSILQIVGALVDVFIAPFFIPLILPLIKKMSDQIPKVRAFSQDLAERTIPQIKRRVENIWQGEGGWLSKTAETVKAIVSIFWNESGLAEWWETETNPFIVSLKYFFKLIGIAFRAVRRIYNIVKAPFEVPKKAIEGVAETSSQTVLMAMAPGVAAMSMSPEDFAAEALGGPFMGEGSLNTNIINHRSGGRLEKFMHDLANLSQIGIDLKFK